MFDTYGWINNSTLTNIANAIRTAKGSTDTYLPSEMAEAILSIDAPLVSDDSACQFLEGTLTEYRNSTATSIPESAFGTTYTGVSTLTLVDLGSATYLGRYAFANTGLITLIIRTNSVCVQDPTSSPLHNTPISKNNGGYIYVPSALVEEYKASTYWRNFSPLIRAIEDYPDICG